MSIVDKRNEALNAEGHYDPTAFNAIKNIEGVYDSRDVSRIKYIEKKSLCYEHNFSYTQPMKKLLIYSILNQNMLSIEQLYILSRSIGKKIN